VISAAQPDEGTGDGGAPPSDATDQGVLEAERLVYDAWEEVLLERRDQMESALEAAFVCCDTAYQYLAAAQRSGDPKAIANAHNTLERALELARKSSIACNRVRQASLGELRRLSREVEERPAASGPAQPDHGTVATGGSQPLCPAAQPGEILPIERLIRRGRRWLARAIMRSQSLIPKPSAIRRKYV
jgi:hypothetical protein